MGSVALPASIATLAFALACLILQHQTNPEIIEHAASVAVVSSTVRTAATVAATRPSPPPVALPPPPHARSPVASPPPPLPRAARSSAAGRSKRRRKRGGKAERWDQLDGDEQRAAEQRASRLMQRFANLQRKKQGERAKVQAAEGAAALLRKARRAREAARTAAEAGAPFGAVPAPGISSAPTPSQLSPECNSKGVYHATLRECRCTAGWDGARCERREPRPCNTLGYRDRRRFNPTNQDSLCAGNCDDDRGLCYCAGHDTPFQRPLPHYCAPWANKETKLPDGRPAYPVYIGGEVGPHLERQALAPGKWKMASLMWERATMDAKWKSSWAKLYAKPFEFLYGQVGDNPTPPGEYQRKARLNSRVPYCRATRADMRRLAISCSGCYEGRTGAFCEATKQSFCVRDCSGNGWCDSGFCWCNAGWFGVDCSEHAMLPAKPSMQLGQALPSPAAASPLRIYVYDMPSMFTTLQLQWRNSPTIGLHRAINGENRSHFTAGSLYAMESALHEWLLDSPLRTRDPAKAHLFFVPIYAASLFMWPIAHFADVPYLGREQRENRRRSHQGALLLKEALQYIRRAMPFWNASGGKDHIWMMLHDEGPCFCPRELRSSILLTHYGYWSKSPRPWGTYYDDNFMQARTRARAYTKVMRGVL